MEYCECGDLRGYLADHTTIPENQVQDIALQVSGALSLMHNEGFAHRDLKPANILIRTKPPGDWWVKIADLGLSKRAESAVGSTTVRGTENFMAPETRGFPFMGEPVLANPFAADLWSLGEVIFRALTGCATFDKPSELVEYQKARLEFPTAPLRRVKASPAAESLLACLMSANPGERITAAEMIQHTWLASLAETTQGTPPPPTTASSHPPTSLFSHEFTEPSGQWTVTQTVSQRGSSPVPGSSQLVLPLRNQGQSRSPSPMQDRIAHNTGQNLRQKSSRDSSPDSFDSSGSSAGKGRSTRRGTDPFARFRQSGDVTARPAPSPPPKTRYHPPSPTGRRAATSSEMSSPTKTKRGREWEDITDGENSDDELRSFLSRRKAKLRLDPPFSQCRSPNISSGHQTSVEDADEEGNPIPGTRRYATLENAEPTSNATLAPAQIPLDHHQLTMGDGITTAVRYILGIPPGTRLQESFVGKRSKMLKHRDEILQNAMVLAEQNWELTEHVATDERGITKFLLGHLKGKSILKGVGPWYGMAKRDSDNLVTFLGPNLRYKEDDVVEIQEQPVLYMESDEDPGGVWCRGRLMHELNPGWFLLSDFLLTHL